MALLFVLASLDGFVLNGDFTVLIAVTVAQKRQVLKVPMYRIQPWCNHVKRGEWL